MFTREEIRSHFENKTVCLVGNSVKLFEKKNGIIIDNYNTVCRFNKGISKLGDLSYGSKMDVYFYSHIMSMPSSYRDNLKKFNNIPLIQTGKHNRNTVINDNTYYVPLTEILVLKEKFNLSKKQDPTTGVVAFNFILSFKPKKIILIGFDWKEYPTFYDLNRSFEPHNYPAEKKYITSFSSSLVEIY